MGRAERVEAIEEDASDLDRLAIAAHHAEAAQQHVETGRFGRVEAVIAQIGLVDGSVRFLSENVTPYTWWYMCTPAGGEVLPPDSF